MSRTTAKRLLEQRYSRITDLRWQDGHWTFTAIIGDHRVSGWVDAEGNITAGNDKGEEE
jgi:hypothetical protein